MMKKKERRVFWGEESSGDIWSSACWVMKMYKESAMSPEEALTI